MGEMRALTIRQPWAQLIALGVKTIETRSWATKYRGPVLIHAGKVEPAAETRLGPWITWAGEILNTDTDDGPVEMALGAVAAVADLVDCVPIVETRPLSYYRLLADNECCRVIQDGPNERLAEILFTDHSGEVLSDFTDQRPFGDFTPGRYGWLLDKVRPLSSPVPAKGRQGLWRPDDALVDAVMEATE